VYVRRHVAQIRIAPSTTQAPLPSASGEWQSLAHELVVELCAACVTSLLAVCTGGLWDGRHYDLGKMGMASWLQAECEKP